MISELRITYLLRHKMIIDSIHGLYCKSVLALVHLLYLTHLDEAWGFYESATPRSDHGWGYLEHYSKRNIIILLDVNWVTCFFFFFYNKISSLNIWIQVFTFVYVRNYSESRMTKKFLKVKKLINYLFIYLTVFEILIHEIVFIFTQTNERVSKNVKGLETMHLAQYF